MKVKVTIGTTYVGFPSESFYIECDSEKDFEKNDAYSTEILNAITCCCAAPHFYIDYDYDCDEEEDEDDE